MLNKINKVKFYEYLVQEDLRQISLIVRTEVAESLTLIFFHQHET